MRHLRSLLTCLAGLLAAAGLLASAAPAGAATSYPVFYNILTARAGTEAQSPIAGANDFSCKPSAAHPDPVVFVHGLLATGPESWGSYAPLLANNGYCVFSLTYGLTPGNTFVGGLKPMEQSAAELSAFVDRVRSATGARKVDLVGHSEGTVMPQYYLKFLGGAAKVARYVAIAPIYQGTTLDGIDALIHTFETAFPDQTASVESGFDSLCGSCRQLLKGSTFYQKLYADGVYAVPGVQYTTIMTKNDELVTPYTSGRLDAPNATNFVLQDGCALDQSEHLSVLWDPRVAQIILNALDPAHPKPLPCSVVLPIVGAPLG